MDILRPDVIVVGAGVAGLTTALDLAPLNVVLLTRNPAGEGGSTAWAQGGIAAAVGADDSSDLHFEDTLTAGAGLCDPAAVRVLVEDAADGIAFLDRMGMAFDRNADGSYSLGREAAHSRKRILHGGGDASGSAICAALGPRVADSSHITVLAGWRLDDLLHTAEGRIAGAIASQGARKVRLEAPATVLATGGLGGLFAQTTNPADCRGDGLALAARAGARLADLEFLQFHPTGINAGKAPLPLATEALRGEGATLIDSRGVRFMRGVHPDAELAPRDVVARAAWRQISQGKGAFLDCREAVGASFPTRFPTVFSACMDLGIDPRTQPIPIAPAQHYHMGGIDVDLDARTSLEGLWAVGEVAATGVHGANRLASNSLIEGIVFGRRAARSIKAVKRLPSGRATPVNGGQSLGQASDGLATLMVDACSVERDGDIMENALHRLLDNRAPEALANDELVAALVLTAALKREESRGGHFRRDFPTPIEALRRRATLTLDDLGSGLKVPVSREYVS